GPRYRRGIEDQVLADLTPEQLIRRGLEKLEQEPHEVVLVSPENLPTDQVSDFVAVDLVSMPSLMGKTSDEPRVLGHVLAYRQWIPHPRDTVAVRLDDDSMHPILPAGSVVAIDRALRDPRVLGGRMVAAAPEGEPLVRWLEVTGRHMILRANQAGRDFPMIPVELEED